VAIAMQKMVTGSGIGPQAKGGVIMQTAWLLGAFKIARNIATHDDD
jgi:hypothetical protein